LYWADKRKVMNYKTIALLKQYGAVNLPPKSETEKKNFDE
jgi:hypothetical protein